MKISSFANSPTTPNPRSGAKPVAKLASEHLVLELGFDKHKELDQNSWRTLQDLFKKLKTQDPRLSSSVAHSSLFNHYKMPNYVLYHPTKKAIRGGILINISSPLYLESLSAFGGGGSALLSYVVNKYPYGVLATKNKDFQTSLIGNQIVEHKLSQFYQKFGFDAKEESGIIQSSYTKMKPYVDSVISKLTLLKNEASFPLPHDLIIDDGNKFP
jgi:hypothetical protein